MENSNRPKLEIRDLKVEYYTKTQTTVALEKVQLSVADGEFVSVVGPSGCGKSTLLKVVSGLLQPAEGAAYIDGQMVQGVPDQ
ncbi:ATP-binding cassette domain-containing protein, partial [Paenibacillus sepulcri]|nr:ATP-binding cassette domain-containing protein [Paenibacillus sepulcri]